MKFERPWFPSYDLGLTLEFCKLKKERFLFGEIKPCDVYKMPRSVSDTK